MSTRVIPLGINGFFPSFGRHTMSVLVLTGTRLFFSMQALGWRVFRSHGLWTWYAPTVV